MNDHEARGAQGQGTAVAPLRPCQPILMDFRRANSQDIEIGHLRQRYLWGPAVDQILADGAVDGGTADLVQWTLTDHLSTVRDIAQFDPQTGATTVVNHLVYDAFGRFTSETDPAVDSLFLFTARPFDEDTQLQNNLNRWYDASFSRWLSEDPIGFRGGINLYGYVGNSPLMQADVTGLENFFVCGRAVEPGPGFGRCTANKCGWLHVDIYGDQSGLVHVGWGGGYKPVLGGKKIPMPAGAGWKYYPLRRADRTVIPIPSPVPILPIVHDKTISWGPAKGKSCKDATDDDVLACLRAKPGRKGDPGAVQNC